MTTGDTGPNCTQKDRPQLHLEEELPQELQAQPISIGVQMGKQKKMNTFNNIKSNMATLETSDYTTARPEYPNTDKAEENDLKNNLRNIIEER